VGEFTGDTEMTDEQLIAAELKGAERVSDVVFDAITEFADSLKTQDSPRTETQLGSLYALHGVSDRIEGLLHAMRADLRNEVKE
jgi:hypothetical protein